VAVEAGSSVVEVVSLVSLLLVLSHEVATNATKQILKKFLNMVVFDFLEM
jgi:hypothetical protein